MKDTLKANPELLKMWATRDKCWMCKHKFAKPVILPVEKIEHGKFQPNYNVDVLFHMHDTHGIPREAVPRMIFNSIYGIDNTLQSVYGATGAME